MPINLYCGNPRSGKSYEVCSVVIFEAVKRGRRVLTNIAGVDQAEYEKLILEENAEFDITKLGKIISVSHEDVQKADFWLTDENKQQEDRSTKENVIQAGDLLALDEVWRFWDGFSPKSSDGVSSPKTVMNFFRMHGHMVNADSGLTCEIALITQDVNDIHRRVRNVIDQTYRMNRLKALGTPNRYRIDLYSGGKLVRTKLIKQMQRSYKKRYFALYKSNSQNAGDVDAKEVDQDGRANIFKSKFLLIFAASMPFILGFSLYKMYHFFNKDKEEIKRSAPALNTVEKTQLPKVPSFSPEPEFIPVYEIVGTIKKQGVKYDVVRGENGKLRYVYGAAKTKLGVDYSIEFENNKVNTWDSINAFSNGNNTGHNPSVQ